MAELGDERARRFHVHFSRIEYSKGGEKRHWTFAETQFGPEPQPLMELLAERGLAPVIICESAGTQAEDAAARMQDVPCKTDFFVFLSSFLPKPLAKPCGIG